MKNILTLSTAATFSVLAMAAFCAPAVWAKPTYVLQSGRKPGQIDRVVTLLEVTGDVIAKVDGKIDREKMSVVCNLSCDEKTLQVPTGSSARWRSVRYYDKASALVKVGKGEIKPTLRPQRRLIAAAIDSQTATLFSPRGPLTRDELELIDVLGNSLLLDRLLPEKPVAAGDTWRHSQALMALLMGVDKVATTNVQSTLTKVTEAAARIEMSGRVEGAVCGVTTEIEIKAKYRFDLRSKRIDWFGLLVKERRNASPVEDGVDAVARVQVQISPKADSTQLAEAALKDFSLEPSAELRQLAYESAEGGWGFTYDRCWHVYGNQANLAVLRMMDRGELVAQCNVSPLQKLAPGKAVSLSEFQADVQKALGESFGKFIQAKQWGNEANYRVYRVVARGNARKEIQGRVKEWPFQWNYYLVTDEQGHRVVFIFTIEGECVERFKDAGPKLVGSLRFLEPQVAVNSEK